MAVLHQRDAFDLRVQRIAGLQLERPASAVFYKNDAGVVFHTYSTSGRGLEVMMGTCALLDLTPKGRDERDVDHKMEWVGHHDRY